MLIKKTISMVLVMMLLASTPTAILAENFESGNSSKKSSERMIEKGGLERKFEIASLNPAPATAKEEPENNVALGAFSAESYTVDFIVDGKKYCETQTINEGELAVSPNDPEKIELDFAGWFISLDDTQPFSFSTPITENLILIAKYHATVKFFVDGKQYLATLIVDEGGAIAEPIAPGKDGYTFEEWRSYQHGVFNFDTPITEHLELTARFTKDPSASDDRYWGMWRAQQGPDDGFNIMYNVNNESKCPNCGTVFKELAKDGPYNYLLDAYYEPGNGAKPIYIVVTCIECGAVNEYSSHNNQPKITYDGGQANGNNMKMGDSILLATYYKVEFLSGDHGLLDAIGPGEVKTDSKWDISWEPNVYPNAGYTHIGWKDQNGDIYPISGGFPETIKKEYVFTAQYSDKKPVKIIAGSGEKEYDGTPLTIGTFKYSKLAVGHYVDENTVEIEGSVTNVSDSGMINLITTQPGDIIIRDSSGANVTELYWISTAPGTLTILPRPITVKPVDKSMVYDGTALAASAVELVSGSLLSGHMLNISGATFGGSQMAVGSSTSTVSGVTVAGGGNNYEISYAPGSLTILPRLITITAASDSKTYDGKALTNSSYSITEGDLTNGQTLVNVTVTGTQIDVGKSSNVPEAAVITDIEEKDVTANYAITYAEGTLTVTERLATYYKVEFSSGDHGLLDAIGPGEVETDSKWNISWEPNVYPDAGYTHIGWKDQNGDIYPISGGFPETIDKEYVFTAQYSEKNPVKIIAGSGEKEYDGTPLTIGTFKHDELAVGHYVDESTVEIEGSVTNVSDSGMINLITTQPGDIIIRDSSGTNVTELYWISTAPGTLTILPRLITITAASDSKTYDGKALTNSSYSITEGDLANGQTLVNVTVTGTQIDVGNSSNVPEAAVITDMEDNDITANYAITYAEGTLTVTDRISTSSGSKNTVTILEEETPAIDIPPLLYLEMDEHHIFIIGYPDNTVRPDRSVSRAEVATIFYRLLKDTYKDGNAISTFSDVPYDSWYSLAVATLAELEILDGYVDGTYKPNNPITRAEFATIASRFAELSTNETINFSDVPPTHWAYEVIRSAYAKGWINGYEDGTFFPNKYITRDEVAKIVNTMLNRLPKELPDDYRNPYTDINDAHWAYIHMMEASTKHEYSRNDDGIEYWTMYGYSETR